MSQPLISDTDTAAQSGCAGPAPSPRCTLCRAHRKAVPVLWHVLLQRRARRQAHVQQQARIPHFDDTRHAQALARHHAHCGECEAGSRACNAHQCGACKAGPATAAPRRPPAAPAAHPRRHPSQPQGCLRPGSPDTCQGGGAGWGSSAAWVRVRDRLRRGAEGHDHAQQRRPSHGLGRPGAGAGGRLPWLAHLVLGGQVDPLQCSMVRSGVAAWGAA